MGLSQDIASSIAASSASSVTRDLTGLGGGGGLDPYAIAGAVAQNVYLPVQQLSGQDIKFEDISVAADGLRLWACGKRLTTGRVWQFDLSVAWDLSTAVLSYTWASSGVAEPNFVSVSSDGSHIAVVDGSNATNIKIWPLTVAGDLSGGVGTLTQGAKLAGSTYSGGLNNDGSQIYISQGRQYSYAMDPAYDASTVSATQVVFDSEGGVGPGIGCTGAAFSQDGTHMYLYGYEGEPRLWSFTLNIPWDPTGGSTPLDYLVLPSTGRGLAFSSTHRKAFICFNATASVSCREYVLP